MANYHLTTKNIARGSGKSCVSSLAYRSATRLMDERTGEVFDYTKKKFVGKVEILLAENAPQWAKDLSEKVTIDKTGTLQKFSKIIESAELRQDARVYREIEFSLPQELTQEQNRALAHAFVKKACIDKGMLAVLSFHDDVDEKTNEKKPHCHVLLSTRTLTEEGFCPTKERSWNRVNLLTEWRELFAELQNEALRKYGHDARVDHRSYEDQGIQLSPSLKLGKNVMEMTARGIQTDRQIEFSKRRISNQFAILKNPDLIIECLSKNECVFSTKDIRRLLDRHFDDAQVKDDLYKRTIESPEVISLDDSGRFTTKTLLSAELNLMKLSEKLSQQNGKTIKPNVIRTAIDNQNKKLEKQEAKLSHDQERAIHHMLSERRFVAVVGYAGAGKTTALEAAKEAWEKAGYKIVGVAPTGRAAENMAQSDIRSMTLHRFLYAQEQGQERISSRSVVVLDEAGMVDSKRFEQLLNVVNKRGAKLVCVGDCGQLEAVEAGAAFRLITKRIDPAVLDTVIRQKIDWQKEATTKFGQGEPAEALTDYADNNMIKIVENAHESLVKSWEKTMKENPSESHHMLAYTKKDVIELNRLAREVLREKGHFTSADLTFTICKKENDELKKEIVVKSERSFACGDRLLFTQNDRGLGVKNGTIGTIVALSNHKITVSVGEKKISFSPKLYPYFDNGWATTIHKSQGVTVDHIKKLATPNEFQNLAYVGMSRHKKSIEVFGSEENFSRVKHVVSTLSSVRDKTSALDFISEDAAHESLKTAKNPSWFAKKWQQGKDFVHALKSWDKLVDDEIAAKKAREWEASAESPITEGVKESVVEKEIMKETKKPLDQTPHKEAPQTSQAPQLSKKSDSFQTFLDKNQAMTTEAIVESAYDNAKEIALFVLGDKKIFSQTRDEIRFGESGRYTVTLSGQHKGRFIDWGSGVKGDVFTMVGDRMGYDRKEAFKWVIGYLGEKTKDQHYQDYLREKQSVSQETESSSSQKSAWKPVFPADPKGISLVDIASNKFLNGVLKNRETGDISKKMTAQFTYRDAENRLLGYVIRIENQASLSEGKASKMTLPLTYCENEAGKKAWRWKGFGDQPPIYGLEKITQSKTSPILIVEGEKTADAAQKLFPQHTVLSWQGGSVSVGKVDWKPVVGRDVIIWPDHDEPVYKAAEIIKEKLTALNTQAEKINITTIVRLPEQTPKSWDLADATPKEWRGVSPESLLSKTEAFDAGQKFMKIHETRFTEVCHFFHFKDHTGRFPELEDKPLVQLMSEKLSNIMVNLVESNFKSTDKLPEFKDVAVQGYKDLHKELMHEKTVADQLAKTHDLPAAAAQAVASALGKESPSSATAETLVAFTQSRLKELSSTESDALKTFRLTRELNFVKENLDETGKVSSDLVKLMQAKIGTDVNDLSLKINQEKSLSQTKQMKMRM